MTTLTRWRDVLRAKANATGQHVVLGKRDALLLADVLDSAQREQQQRRNRRVIIKVKQ